MRPRHLKAALVLTVVVGGIGLASSPAAGDLTDPSPVCVDIGLGANARTLCGLPGGSRLLSEAPSSDCVIESTGQAGTVRFSETPGTVVPRIPIPEYEWWEVHELNEFYLEMRVQYGGEVRFFWKQCQSRLTGINVTIGVRPIAVPITDPLLDIRVDVTQLVASIPLPTPRLSTLPEPEVFYGLKVNSPGWFAVTPDSWRSVTTSPRWMRGWMVTLTIRPVALSFSVNQGGRSVSVACDPSDQRYVPGSSRFPTEPVGFTDESNWFDSPEDPLPQRPCTWTPRAAGSGTVGVTITYDVTASAGGFLFEFAPRTNTAVVPIDVTELRTVNLRPGL